MTRYPRDKCLHQLFEEQVKAKPLGRALTFGNQFFTYSEINKRSNQLAR